VDEFAMEVRPGARPLYRFGAQWRPLTARSVTLRYRLPNGTLATRTFTTWRTHRGPIVRTAGDRWVAFAMMDRPVPALEQSFLRTKAPNLAFYLRVARLQANSSNSTLLATDRGDIAYLHPQFVPVRDDSLDYTGLVDGSDPRADWRGLHPIGSLPNVINPASGRAQNTNAWPYRAAGPSSPDPRRFPRYMDIVGENYRGIHAQQLLAGSRGWTVEKLRAAAYDSYQPGFAELIPPLVAAYDALPRRDQRRRALAAPIELLRSWDYRWSAGSTAQSLAMFWGEALQPKLPKIGGEPRNRALARLAAGTTPAQKLDALTEALARLRREHGDWRVPWGQINRFQRVSPAILHPFSDAAPSIPVPFASAIWGSLASFGSAPKPGTLDWYGASGNSFVAVVEFGPQVRAVAVTAGGESGNPSSPHFTDQAQRYASGALRPVYLTPDQLRGHTDRVYRPGQ